MRRREFNALLAGAALFPFAARAEQDVRKIGVLMAGAESAPDNQARLTAFRQGLAALGWKEGDNIQIVYRWSAGKRELIQKYTEELIALRPDAILANSTPVVTAFKKLNSTVPIVFALDIDPVGLGHVASISRPGGNITGFTFIDPALIGKWIALLKEVAPGLKQATLLFSGRVMPSYQRFLHEVRSDLRTGDVELKGVSVATTEEMEEAIAALAREPGNGLLIGPDPFNQVRIKELAQITREKRLPTISVYRPFVNAGGLMAYGPDTSDIFRRSAGYIDRVLKGANPGELPIQEPTKFEFIVNLKTAKALDISVSPSLLALADEVIE